MMSCFKISYVGLIPGYCLRALEVCSSLHKMLPLELLSIQLIYDSPAYKNENIMKRMLPRNQLSL